MRSWNTPPGYALALAGAALAAIPAAGPAQTTATAPAARGTLQMSTGRGRLVTLSRPMSDLFVANPEIADVQVRSPTLLYVFGKKPGETTVSATARGGGVVYAATVRIGNNYDSIQQMLGLALPDAKIVATPLNGMVLLTGTVAGPEDGAEAEKLVAAFVGEGTKVVSRLRTATPLQVNLQVKFAEVNRSFLKNIGNNLVVRDTTGGFRFNLQSGRLDNSAIGNASVAGLPTLDASARFGLAAGSIFLPFDPKTGNFVLPNSGSAYNVTRNSNTRSTLGLAGRLLGLDILSAIDLGETMGQVTTLANPNLTALSGETGTFLAGGEIPVPISQALGTVTIEYKQFGVSLAYTPTVLSDGRISLRVRPEVSQLDYANAVTVTGGGRVPALTTRRAETTVELGSGQSFMIAGLMSNSHANTFDKTPGVADIPILGALFKSNAFQRNETELVIVITPYLVKPVNANDIVLPTDGYKAPTDLGRVLLDQLGGGTTGGDRPKPRMEGATDAPATPAQPPRDAADRNKAAPAPAPGSPK